MASLEMTRKFKRKNPEAYHKMVKRLFCDSIEGDFKESDFFYEPESPRKDSSTGCLTGVKRAKSQVCLLMKKSQVSGLDQLIEYLGLDINVREEGIFRKSGSLKKQQDLLEKINKGEEVSLFDGEFSIHECASVLKTCLGNLPEPLVTNSCFPAHLQVALLHDKYTSQEDMPALVEKQIFCTQLLIELIPEEYFKLLKDLLFLLHGVCQREEENKMSSTNLGVIFCTHILSPRSMPPGELQSKLGVLTNATTFLIENPSILFTLPEKLLAEVQSFQCRRNREGRRSLAKRSSQGGPGVECLIANTVFSFIPMEEGAAGEQNEKDDDKESNFVCDQLESTVTSQFNLNIEIMNIKK
eukprot:GFUD01049637.1.p1 GENE.GFUD01049637.1~~GFUD01049637.1.p1  ORF type:complete len:355 (-),score=103.45 GFUD01049637.1:5-1069(-)